MIIVLETSGKRDSVDYVKVNLFSSKSRAEEYCKMVTDNSMDEKYWRYAQIVKRDQEYEIGRYENIES